MALPLLAAVPLTNELPTWLEMTSICTKGSAWSTAAVGGDGGPEGTACAVVAGKVMVATAAEARKARRSSSTLDVAGSTNHAKTHGFVATQPRRNNAGRLRRDAVAGTMMVVDTGTVFHSKKQTGRKYG